MGWVANAISRPPDPREKNPVPIVREDGWAPRPAWTGAENLTRTRVRSPNRPAGSESLHQLRYIHTHGYLRALTGSDRYDLSHPSETEYLMLNTCHTQVSI